MVLKLVIMVFKCRHNIAIILLLILEISMYSAEPIKLGTSSVFSGSSRDLGRSYFTGAGIYFDYINSTGGVKGRNIEVIAYDDRYEPSPCIENTVKLITKDKVDMLFNYVGTPTTTAILPLLKVYEKSNIILFGNLTGAGGQRSYPYGQYIFNVRASYKEETSKLVEFFINKGLTNIGIVYQIDSYGRSGYDGVQQSLKASGYKISAEATYIRGEEWSSSMEVHLKHIMSKDVDAIISVGSYEACGALIRDARLMGISVPIANVSFVGVESLIGLLKSSMIPLDDLYITQVVPDYTDHSLPIIKEYNNLISKNELTPNFISLEGFINAKLLVEILSATDIEITRRNIKNIIESMPPMDIGLGKKLKFTQNDHQLLHDVYIFMIKEDGTMEVIR